MPDSISNFDLFILSERTGSCKIYGEFAGESTFTEWGEGEVKRSAHSKKENIYPDLRVIPQSRLQILVNEQLVDPLADPVSQNIFLVGKVMGSMTLTMRWPVRTFDKVRAVFLRSLGITYLIESKDSPGDYVGKVSYLYPETKEVGSALIKLTCGSFDSSSMSAEHRTILGSRM